MSQVPAKDAGKAEAELVLSYERHQKFAEQAKADYLALNREMIANLSTDHFECFAKILHERENVVLQQQPLIESLRENLLQLLEQKLHAFWADFDVANSLTKLEMLKEKFREFEGTDWNLQCKNPQQRTLPTRMRFNEMRLRYLRTQLQFQNTELEEIKKLNGIHRAHIQEIEQQRSYLGQTMELNAARFKQAKPELLRMQNEAAECGQAENDVP